MTNDKCQQLLCFITKLYKHCSLLSLSRLCFLVDYLAYEKMGRLVSGLDYKLYCFGPFNTAIIDQLDILVIKEFIRPNTDQFMSGADGINYCFNDDLLMGDLKFKAEFLPDISISEFYTARDILYLLFDYNEKEINRLVYNTKPVKFLRAQPGVLAKIGSPIDFEVYKSE